MRLKTLEEVKAYISKGPLWLTYLTQDNESRIEKIRIERYCFHNSKEQTEDEFGWVYSNQVGRGTSRLSEVGVFTDFNEAKAYLSELIGNIVVYDDPSGDVVDIYRGGFCYGMERIDKELFSWSVDGEYMGTLCRHITLNDIYNQAVKKGLIKESTMLIVFHTSSLHGTIYRCGNYGKGVWDKAGVTNGYV